MATLATVVSLAISGVVRGDAYAWSVPVTDEAGDAADLTGYTAAASVLTSGGDTVDLDASISSGSVLIDATAAMTAQFTLTNRIQVEITSAGGDPITVARGTLTTVADIA